MEIGTELVGEVRKYLVGPHKDDEELPRLPNYPLDFYISGILFPINTELETEDKELLATGSYQGGEDDANSDDNYGTGWLKQNSIGIRCDLKEDVKKILLDIKFGKYVLTETNAWKRRQVHPTKNEPHVLLLEKKGGELPVTNDAGETEAMVTWKIDEGGGHGSLRYRVLTVFLSNAMQTPPIKDEKGKKIDFRTRKKMENERTIFQPFIKISGADNSPPFTGNQSDIEGGFMSEEDQSLALLFRNRRVYAQGYQCAASWEKNTMNPKYVNTEIMPNYVSKRISVHSTNSDERPCLVDIVTLAYAKNPEKIKTVLQPMISLYEKWIQRLDDKIENLKKEHPNLEEIAIENKEGCEDALRRMRDGLSLITDGKHPEIFDAFVLANRAMLYQRVHYEFAIGKSKGKKEPIRCPDHQETGKTFWRPFQIAFIIMNLRGIADKKSNERKLVDLLWFPTGGGKTEAYLGLAAFSILLRRIRGINDGSGGSGVSVIMRYTLRLLTLQQFERAASLTCALEILRRDHIKKLGNEPFLIGLWVGWSLTPNSTKASEEALKRKAKGEDPLGGSPDQLIFCPWCGHEITWRNFIADNKNSHTNWTLVHCSNTGCEFYHPDKTDVTKALPIITVDTDIYHRCPSILIGTVDKFARMPWRPDSASIFGLVDRYCPRHGFLTSAEDHASNHTTGKPVTVSHIEHLEGPDLIIQDELHLISGPLGTMVGLYETAVEHLSSRRVGEFTLKPKIVVSTATVRGVDHQIRNLFNRDPPRKFPPPGVDYGDTFFWWEDENDGREYVGVSYSHRSMKFALARLFASLLQKVHELKTASNIKKTDPYWTLVGYFNSIRELGGAIRLVEDDVKSNINSIVHLVEGHQGFSIREIKRPQELTGRVNGQEIREIRKILEKAANSAESIDVLLATNMISVGIDVDRLGLMVITGQPKNSTEYIQVTGRIGRREGVPGLVFTLYNPYKPRDLSHYENFVGHHATIQKSVEAVSLTPFSERSMERALHAVFLAIIRLTIPNLSKKEHANNLALAKKKVEQIHQVILDRYSEIQNVDRSKPEYLELGKKIKDFQDNWQRYIEEARKAGNADGIWYNNPYDPYDVEENKNNMVMMIDFAEKKADPARRKFPLATPGSMRDVEKEAGLYYL